ncbi:MAG TPA: hypothetical protein VHO84_10570 [Syntrophorhabdaceae bacterium]|nr:hypothetical protein [Syntrophorhabdaceae bacterium]
MKRKSILIFSLAAVLLFCACGKKAPPRPTILPLAGGINDLAGEVKDGVLFLSFSIPQKNRDGSEITDLGGFRIVKSCGTCSGTFEPFKNISLEDREGYTIERGRLYVYDDDLTSGVEYGYRVHPYTRKGTPGDASNTFVTRWERPPDPPKGVTVSTDDGIVELRWTYEQTFFYNVYRYNDGTYPIFPLNESRLPGSSYMDTGLTNNVRYTYDVRKVQEIGGVFREGRGLKIAATPIDRTPPRVPEEMKAEKRANAVFIAWRENTDKDLTGYNVYRTVNGSRQKLNGNIIKTNSFQDRNTPNERYVSYSVTAVDTAGNESDFSRESIVILKE